MSDNEHPTQNSSFVLVEYVKVKKSLEIFEALATVGKEVHNKEIYVTWTRQKTLVTKDPRDSKGSKGSSYKAGNITIHEQSENTVLVHLFVKIRIKFLLVRYGTYCFMILGLDWNCPLVDTAVYFALLPLWAENTTYSCGEGIKHS